MPGNNRSSRVPNQTNLVDTVERSKSCDTISFVRLSVINNETFGSLFCHKGRVFVHNDYPGGCGFLPPSSHVLGVGMVNDEIDSPIHDGFISFHVMTDSPSVFIQCFCI